MNSTAVKPAPYELWMLNNDGKQMNVLRQTSKMNMNLGVCQFLEFLSLSLKILKPSFISALLLWSGGIKTFITNEIYSCIYHFKIR